MTEWIFIGRPEDVFEEGFLFGMNVTAGRFDVFLWRVFCVKRSIGVVKNLLIGISPDYIDGFHFQIFQNPFNRNVFSLLIRGGGICTASGP